MTFLPQNTWDNYKKVLDDFYLEVANQSIIWLRTSSGLDRYMEGETSYEEVGLKGLADYPSKRMWPTDGFLSEGQLQENYLLIYLNRKYLEEKGLLVDGELPIDLGRDRFKIFETFYKCRGITNLAQANDEPLFLGLILEAEEDPTTYA